MQLLLGTVPPIAELPSNFYDWLGLLGRMHVVVIHFPVALLLVAALGEVWGRVRGRVVGWTTATLVFGAVGALFSMALGWMLIWFSGYECSRTLTRHKYLGTATAIIAIVAVAAHFKLVKGQARWWATSLVVVTAAMVALTGHLGGTLVYGDLFAP